MHRTSSATSLTSLTSLPSGSHASCSVENDGFEHLRNQYRAIFHNEEIKELPWDRRSQEFLDVPNVDMDALAVIKLAPGASVNALGTTHLATCIAICGRGQTPTGEWVLGLIHSSGVYGAWNCLDALMAEMSALNCEPSSIKIYLIGGMKHHPEHAVDLLAECRRFNIAGAKLPLNEEEDEEAAQQVLQQSVRFLDDSPGASVLLTEEGCFYAQNTKLCLGEEPSATGRFQSGPNMSFKDLENVESGSDFEEGDDFAGSDYFSENDASLMMPPAKRHRIATE